MSDAIGPFMPLRWRHRDGFAGLNPPDWVEWDGRALWSVFGQGQRREPFPCLTLAQCLECVADGEWVELDHD